MLSHLTQSLSSRAARSIDSDPHTFDMTSDEIQTILTQALAASRGDRAQEAEACSRAVLTQYPDHYGAMNVLGLAYFEQGKYAEAEQCFIALTRSHADWAIHWKNLAATLRAQERYDDAFRCYVRAAHRGAGGAAFLYDVALLQIDRQQFDSARYFLKRARGHAPNDAAIRVVLADCCVRTLRREEALENLQAWESFDGLNDELIARIAALLQSLGQPSGADCALQRIIATGVSARALLVAVHVLERGNRLQEAESLLGRVAELGDSALDADIAAARAHLCARRGDYLDACQHWRKRIETMPKNRRRYEDLFSYARSLDALGHVDEAYATLLAAHEAQVQELRRCVPGVFSAPDIAKLTSALCDPDDRRHWIGAGAPTRDASPIFIVGFPRSGTTLLEQALDAHPQLRAMDEQPFVQNVIDQWTAEGIDYPRSLAMVSEEQLRSARVDYWRRVSSRVSLAPGERLIDKNPLNLLRLAAVQRLFPHAPIVLCVRHPCDAIWSCFMQQFAAPEFALLCRDVTTLARGYRSAFDAWYAQAGLLLPDVYELSYERLAAHFEAEMKKLCTFLHIEWHDDVLLPHVNAGRKPYVSTPSYAQILEPVTTHSIGRWQRYRANIAPALPILQPYLRRWNYAG